MFVTFEGPEGAGKSTVLRLAAAHLRDLGKTVFETREPGAGEVGGQIRQILLHGGDLPPASELFLFLADRANHVATMVRPRLAEGEWVLCDRHADSTFVYQSSARGLDADFVRSANTFATGGLKPDVTLLFDVPAEVGLARLTAPGRLDRLDREPIEFHRRVRDGFLALAAQEPNRFRIIDATQPVERVLEEVLSHLLAKATS